MTTLRSILLFALIPSLAPFLDAHSHKSHDAMDTTRVAQEMLQAANAFLESLNTEQRNAAIYPFESDVRTRWNYASGKYPGVQYYDLDEESIALGETLLKSGLSASGYTKTQITRELEQFIGAPSPHISIAIFGEPSDTGAWGWWFIAHHLSLHFTLFEGKVVAATPAFFGTRPLAHPTVHGGKHALDPEQLLAQGLYRSLNDSQRMKATLDRPGGTIPVPSARTSGYTDRGIAVSAFAPEQRALFKKLLQVYVDNFADPLQPERAANFVGVDPDQLFFVFNGSTAKRGENLYYRIQGPSFIIEYDSRNNNTHVHTVFREFEGDFGHDVLAEHLRNHAH